MKDSDRQYCRLCVRTRVGSVKKCEESGMRICLLEGRCGVEGGCVTRPTLAAAATDALWSTLVVHIVE